MAGTQGQAGRGAGPGSEIVKSRASCGRYGAAAWRGNKERAIWMPWKVIKATVIGGDRGERQQREQK